MCLWCALLIKERERESLIEEYSMVSSQKQEPQKQNVSGTIETRGFYNPPKKRGKNQYIAISNELYKVFMFPIEFFKYAIQYFFTCHHG
jgi:hypothetical protein